ncbi:hypothetical protein EON62_02525 [archaeon]|nr:MAG: hypothetical protein EON62_02525 [archaeon]
MPARVHLLSADWRSLAREVLDAETAAALHLHLASTDVILASEVLYNVEYYPALLQLLAACLRPDAGVAWIATKRFYYGVGGGVGSFVAALAQYNRCNARVATFSVDTVASMEDGKSMVRDILAVRLIPSRPPTANAASPA